MRGWRTGAAVILAALGCSLAGTAAASPSLRPPAGTPDPRQMVLRPADLHAAVKHQHYFRDTQFPSTISYERAFGHGKTGKARLAYADSIVEVGSSATVAARYLALVRQLARSDGEFNLTKSFAREIGDPDDVNANLRVGDIRDLAVGNGSLDFPMSTTIRGRRTEIHIALFRVDRLLGEFALVGVPGAHVSLSAATVLAKLMTKRMSAELAPKNVALPVLSGTAQVGQTLTSSSGLWNGNPASLSYVWQRCDASGAACVDIAGATGQAYAVGQADAGSTIRVSVTARNGFGSTTVSSAPTTIVGASAGPTNTALPTITGSAQLGQTVTASTGSWSGDPTSFGFQWQHCDASGNGCVAIPGATSGTYAVAASDSGGTIRVAVTANNASGSATAVSAPTTVVP